MPVEEAFAPRDWVSLSEEEALKVLDILSERSADT
jgi:hypothetical protein